MPTVLESMYDLSLEARTRILPLLAAPRDQRKRDRAEEVVGELAAHVFLDLGDYARAEELALRYDEHHVTIRAAMQQGQKERARQHFERVVGTIDLERPDVRDAFLAEAKELYSKAELPAALAPAIKWYEENKLVTPLLLKAFLAVELRQTEEANKLYEDFKKKLGINTTHLRPVGGYICCSEKEAGDSKFLGELCIWLGRHDEAVQLLLGTGGSSVLLLDGRLSEAMKKLPNRDQIYEGMWDRFRYGGSNGVWDRSERDTSPWCFLYAAEAAKRLSEIKDPQYGGPRIWGFRTRRAYRRAIDSAERRLWLTIAYDIAKKQNFQKVDAYVELVKQLDEGHFI